MKTVLTVNGSRKFATMPSRKVAKALKHAQQKGIIEDIPDSVESRLELLRKIAVVANNSQGYTFLETDSMSA